jgi:hypothetical protein
MGRRNWQSWYCSIFIWENSHKSRNFVILVLTNRGNMELVCFQQDSALAYFTLNVREFMNEAFPDRWVFRGCAAFPSTMPWPPCNPDLTTADSSLWGIIKHKLAVHRSTPTTKLTSGHYWCLRLFKHHKCYKSFNKVCGESSSSVLNMTTVTKQIRWALKLLVWLNKWIMNSGVRWPFGCLVDILFLCWCRVGYTVGGFICSPLIIMRMVD